MNEQEMLDELNELWDKVRARTKWSATMAALRLLVAVTMLLAGSVAVGWGFRSGWLLASYVWSTG